ncbi:MAG: LemA family protein [Deltaproteobacteria bacterium]|nr:LemA family protein [Deltaproteobacteria bacterium]
MVGIAIVLVAAAGLLFIGLLIYGIGIYNGLIQVKNNIKKSWANIDVLLKQRTDELPKLIESVKGYMAHERGVLEKVTEARTQFLSATTVAEKAQADNVMTQAIKSLFAVAENYPNLKANENFLQLQGRISGIENEIADRREFYNDSVNTYNIRIASIPDLFVARMMGLQPEEMFKTTEADRQDVQVKFA